MQKCKVAVVDDNQDYLECIYYLLRDRYAVLRYRSGEEGIRGIREDYPHLIILDISMPGMDGLDVLKIIRKDRTLNKVPVIAVTANAMTGDRERYIRAGFDEYISKPVDNELLLKILAKQLSGYSDFEPKSDASEGSPESW